MIKNQIQRKKNKYRNNKITSQHKQVKMIKIKIKLNRQLNSFLQNQPKQKNKIKKMNKNNHKIKIKTLLNKNNKVSHSKVLISQQPQLLYKCSKILNQRVKFLKKNQK